jgi:hypothetical protein
MDIDVTKPLLDKQQLVLPGGQRPQYIVKKLEPQE